MATHPDHSPHPTGTLATFVAELRRRHVVRVGLAYAAGVFVALQMAEIVLPAFLFGREADAWLRLLVVAFTLFFPVVAVLAWVYEITPGGVRSMAALDREAGRRPQGHLVPRLALLLVTVLATTGGGAVWYRVDAAQIEAEAARRAAWATSFARPAGSTATEGGLGGLVVLPIVDLGADPSGAWFAPSLEEALVSRLGEVAGLRVVSRTTASHAAAADQPLAQIARTLGVDAVIEGSVLRVGEAVRINLRMIEADTDARLWGVQIEGDLAAALTLQAEVADQLARALVEVGGAAGSAPGEPARIVDLKVPSALSVEVGTTIP